ncbi:uncharacterized protein LOC117173093 [Belonocnema kinseyi]|uniref:uncharacterized protein LOC117173093 n=1 Tax=Belonocnema kinseyi TaxID=2817044 RepID=UPI00143D49D7|nr:uncharacterized protein LOC117173093 [Belonocnema kinseyi]
MESVQSESGNDNPKYEPPKRKRKRFNFQEKEKIVQEAKTKDMETICRKYKIGESTLRKWKKQEDDIFDCAKTVNLKNAKKATNTEELDWAMYAWLMDFQNRDIPVTGPIARQKALELNKKLRGPNDFKASKGWLEKWKKRMNLSALKITENNSRVKRLKQTAVPSVNLGLEVIDIESPVKKIKTESSNKTEEEENKRTNSFQEKNAFEIENNHNDEDIYTEDVKILDEPSEETLRRAILELDEPILLRNIIRKLNGENIWNLLDWDLKTLAKKFGNVQLPFRTGHIAQTSRPQWEVECPMEWFTMKDFIKKNDFESWYYFDYKYMHEWCKNSPEILQSLNWNRFGFDLDGKDSTIWIGSKGAHTNCHQDSYGCNLVAQIHGKKEWILFPPEAAERLKPVRVPYEESTIYSSINFFSPSEDEIKLLKNIPGARTVILDPGEVLLVPKSWWHYVESLNLSVSVNVWLPLETDSKERLKEALVKLIVNGIGKNIPSASENSKCSVSDCINFVNISLEEIKTQKESSASFKNNNETLYSAKYLTEEYPFCVCSLQNFSTENLETFFLKKRNRFSRSIDNSKTSFVKLEEPDPSNQPLIENIVNAFCNLGTIEKVADFLLNGSSR